MSYRNDPECLSIASQSITANHCFAVELNIIKTAKPGELTALNVHSDMNLTNIQQALD